MDVPLVGQVHHGRRNLPADLQLLVRVELRQVVGEEFCAAVPHYVVFGTAGPEEPVEVGPTHVVVQQTHRLGQHAHAQQGHDVGMAELGHQRHLVLKVLLHLLRRVLAQHLHRHQVALLAVVRPRHLRLEDTAVGATPDVPHEDNVVASELQLLQLRVDVARDGLALVVADVGRKLVDVNVKVVGGGRGVVQVLVLEVESTRHHRD